MDFFLGGFEGEAQGGEGSLGGAVGLAEEAEEEVFGANVVGLGGFGGFDGVEKGLLKVGSAAQRAENEGIRLVVAVDGIELFLDVVERDMSVFEDASGDAIVVFEDG